MTSRAAWAVVDLGFGDAGKGTVTDFLVRDRGATLVVRFNGGGQAGHNVVTADARHHTFAQFGAGTLAGPHVGTHLGPSFVLHPGGLAVEARVLAEKGAGDVFDRATVDARARVTSPVQQAAGRLRELLRAADAGGAHGTTGVGVGETVADALAGNDDALCAGDLRDPRRVRSAVARQQERKRAELDALGIRALGGPAEDELYLLDDPGLADRVVDAWAPVVARLRVLDPDAAAARIGSAPVVVLEGAQGVLLDETWGFHPHTTWSDCTFGAATALVEDRPVFRLGVTRAYATRHGPGPFPSERPDWRAHLAEPHNPDHGWQGRFRVGPLDGVLLGYAAAVAGGPLDGVAVTCVDRVSGRGAIDVVTEYHVDGARWDTLDPGSPVDLAHRASLGWALRRARCVHASLASADALFGFVADRVGAPVVLRSDGPTAVDKAWCNERPAPT